MLCYDRNDVSNVLMFITQVNQKSELFVTIGIF